MALTVTRPKKQKKPCLLCSSFRDEGSDPNLANPSGEPTCLWMMLRRKSGWRLRHRRWPKRSDWFRLFTCSRTCGGGLRGGPLSTRSEQRRSENRENWTDKFHKKLFTDKARFHSGTNEDWGPIRSAVCDGHIQVTTEGRGLNATRITQATNFWGSSCLPQPPYQQ